MTVRERAEGFEEKVRRVRTQAGVRHFGLPIGSPIVPGLPVQLELPDMPERPTSARAHDVVRAGKTAAIRRVARSDYANMERRYDEETNHNEWADEGSGWGGLFYEEFGIDLEDADRAESLPEVLASGSDWTQWDECRAVREAAYELLGFNTDDDSRADPHLTRRSPTRSAYRPQHTMPPTRRVYAYAYGLLRGIYGDEATVMDRPLYRGVKVPDVDAFINSLREGQQFNMPLASFTDNRKHTDRFGNDVTFVLERGARAVKGGYMGPDPGIEEDSEAYWEAWDWDQEEGKNLEFVAGGRFRIRAVKRSNSGNVVVQLVQVGVFDPDSGVVEKKEDGGNGIWEWDFLFDFPLATVRVERQEKADGNHVQTRDVFVRFLKTRRVRTPQGMAHFGQPIGTVIVRDIPLQIGPGRVGGKFRGERSFRRLSEDSLLMERRTRGTAMRREESEYAQWKKYRTPDGHPYYVGKEKRSDQDWIVTNEHDMIVAVGPTEGEAFRDMLRHLGMPIPAKPKWMEDMRPAKTRAEALAWAKKHNTTIPPNYGQVHILKDKDSDARKIAGAIQADGTWRAIYSVEATEEGQQQKWQRIAKLGPYMERLDGVLENADNDDEVAAVVKIMRLTGMRPDSSDTQRGAVPTFGATSLQARHVKINPGGSITFAFVGKSGKKQSVNVSGDDKLLAMMKRLKRGKSHSDRLFPSATAAKAADFIRSATKNNDILVKDLRTYLANALAADALDEYIANPPTSQKEFDAMRREVADQVSSILGNTRAVALSNYISPAVFLRFDKGGWS